ncbi:MAG: exonuclease SbcCD subunit D [Desulfobulbaceae bacterium]
MRFIHTADIHLGKTYRGSPGEAQRYDDFFSCLETIVADSVREAVDFVLICGDLFHTGQILPRTLARTIETLQPLKDAAIPCIAVEGNHDWIHRRDSISWMEALSEMGYITLLRPERTSDGGYAFPLFDADTGRGGRIEIDGLTIYGVGYIGAQAGSHVHRICDGVATDHNLLLFHVGVWQYSPVEIGNMRIEEALPLAGTFDYVALGHGHKPYTIATPDGVPFAFNPGAPERVNFGEQEYDKGYYLVTRENGRFEVLFRPTDPRPMAVLRVDLDGCGTADEAMDRFRDAVRAQTASLSSSRAPLLELKLTGRVGFHPFELARERLRVALDEVCAPLHLEVRNHLSRVTRAGGETLVKKSLADIEREVLVELLSAHSLGRDREEELADLALAIRDLALRDKVDDEELLGLLDGREI